MNPLDRIGPRALDRGTLAVFVLGSLACVSIVPRAAYSELAEPATQALYGYLLWVATLPVLRLLGKIRLERQVVANFLALMPLVYVGAGVRADARGELWIEALGVVVFGALAFLGVRKSPWFLALGVLGHGLGWDLWHLHRERTVPAWYALACAVIDASVAVYIVGRIPAWRSLGASSSHSQTGHD